MGETIPMNISRVLLATLLCVSIALCGKAQSVNSSDADTILRLETNLNSAWLRHDTATIESLVAADYQSWSFKGIRRTKADLLQAVKRNNEIDTKVDDPVVRVYGDAAVYTARITDTGKHPNGDLYTAKTCLTSMLIRRQNVWQIVATHETMLQ
jgi:ketosteroid isomerase-like protein